MRYGIGILIPITLAILASGRLIFLSLGGDATYPSRKKNHDLNSTALPEVSSLPSTPSVLSKPTGSDDSPACRVANSSVLMPMFPTFIIVGAQKAGTSALHHILKHHPDIIGSRGLEPHFFDARGDSLSHLDTTGKICQARNQYARFFDMDRILARARNETSPLIVFEKTPSYMLYPHIPTLIKKLCPWTKIIISLRDPVDRLRSSYLGDDLDEELERQLDSLRRAGLIRAPPLHSFVPGAENASQFEITRRIRQTHNQKGKVASRGVFRGFYALQIAHWLPHFPLGESLLVVKDFQGSNDRVKVLSRILEFVGAPPFEFEETTLNAVYGPNNGPNRKRKEPLSFKTRYYLRRLYQPYNAELATLLGEEWKGVWDG